MIPFCNKLKQTKKSVKVMTFLHLLETHKKCSNQFEIALLQEYCSILKITWFLFVISQNQLKKSQGKDF